MKTEDMFIEETLTVLQTMQRMDVVAKKILFVVKNKKLLATVTDGDIRRWILSNGKLDAPIGCAANYHPKYIMENEEKKASAYMDKYGIEVLPVVNKEHEIMKIIFEKESAVANYTNELSDIPVVIMAGGLGTRLYPYTKILPKPLIPVGDVPIIEHIMNEFNRYGCQEFYLIVNHKKNMIKAYLNERNLPYKITYVDEDKPLGTGGGLGLLKGQIKSTFILSNCDIIVKENIAKICKLHKEKEQIITMVCSAQNFTIPYGVIELGQDGELKEMREKPSLSFLTNTGCYIVEAQVIDEVENEKAVDFPDIIEKYKSTGEKVGIYPISENLWMDMGQIDELTKMELTLKESERK